MQRDPYPPELPLAPWVLLALIGVVLVAAALAAALSGSGTELAGAHFALKKVCVL